MVHTVRGGLDTVFLLFAEDDSTQSALLALACRKAGLGCSSYFICRDGAQLIDFVERAVPPNERFPLPTRIITDLRMPLMDGFQALQQLRSRPVFSGVPITLFSSGLTPELRHCAEMFGASEAIEKTMSFQQLIEQVQRWAWPSRLSWSIHAPGQRWLFDEIS